MSPRSEKQFEDLQIEREKDSAYALEDSDARFRLNIFFQQSNYAIVARLIKAEVPEIANLTLPVRLTSS